MSAPTGKTVPFPSTTTDAGLCCVGLFLDGKGGGVWKRIRRHTAPESSWCVDFQRLFRENRDATVIYDELSSCYAAMPDLSQVQLLRYVTTAPWLARDADAVRVGLAFRDPTSKFFTDTTCTLNRYEIAGPTGQLLRDIGDAVCKGGIGVAIIDAFMWLRNLLVGPAAVVSPLYLLIGLAVGVLMYLVGLLLRTIYTRVYCRTAAFAFDANGLPDASVAAAAAATAAATAAAATATAPSA